MTLISVFLLNKTLLLHNILSNNMFREPTNKSDGTEFKEQKNFPKKEIKGTQPNNERENKEVAFYQLAAFL